MSDSNFVDFVVGGPNSYFSDDKKAACFKCQGVVFYRPHAPIPTRGYACLLCVMEHVEEKDPEPVSMVTDQTLEEVRQELKKN